MVWIFFDYKSYDKTLYSFVLSLFPLIGDCSMTFYKEKYANINTQKSYFTLLPLGSRKERGKIQENKNNNIYTWVCPFEYDLI